jgi:hypothetical protein
MLETANDGNVISPDHLTGSLFVSGRTSDLRTGTLGFLGQAARSRRLRGTTMSRSCAMVGKATAEVPQALTAARKWIEDHA